MNARMFKDSDAEQTASVVDDGSTLSAGFRNTCPNNHEVLPDSQVSVAQGVTPPINNTGLVPKPGDLKGLTEVPEGFPTRAIVNRGGRPEAITPELLEQLCLLLSTGLSRRQAAAHLGVAHNTLSKTAARNEEVARALAVAEEMRHAQCILRIAHESRTNWRAAAWLLSHAAKAPPPKLTEEEKQQEHSEKIADLQRTYELYTIEESLQEEKKEARDKRALLREQKKRMEERAQNLAAAERERLRKEQRRAARESGAA